VERDSLWYNVLSACYGMEWGRVREGGRDVYVWWRDISALRTDEWFHGNVRQFVGDGKNTLFWIDVWVGGVSFKDRFPR